MDADKLAQQLELTRKTLLALEAYLAQAKSIVTDTRMMLDEAQRCEVGDEAGPGRKGP